MCRRTRAASTGMVALVERMLALQVQLAAAKSPTAKTTLQRQIAATDRLVYELYELTEVLSGGMVALDQTGSKAWALSAKCGCHDVHGAEHSIGGERMKYKVHRFNIRMTRDEVRLEQFLNRLEGEIVAIIPNVTAVPSTFVNFVLIVEKVGGDGSRMKES